MMGLGEMVQWFGSKITWTWKLEMFINEKLPFNPPAADQSIHHSIIPSGRQELRPRKNAFNLNELYKFRDVELHGCQLKRKRGSHHILTFPGAKRAVVIPEYDEIDVDIIKNNMRTVGMSREEYFELLNKV